ncbi:protein of unknown function [Taphrina deformans PYCC 5710]|uniref:Magnesium-dependent phosphatase-1 n=1 Tax=Taphrina deformans (strain PYCC 5710 / ATCC 11124 / CBS 356.35 / IMI 108563 / JCM 9778 / NBRC 8474) TaxID=1097556 RepID=R4XF76_TAPDE|nr:protein of unknown function [Taphrina deformans PYCC 5710]|eukprot:CCG84308.1 protein of unknown function [Taphrina deformans PYCC 5710]
MAPRMPKMIVFDLDYTLWDLWIDTHISSPLKVSSQSTGSRGNQKCNALVDRHGTDLEFYHDVPSILVDLQTASVQVGIASRTSAPDLARTALSLLTIDASPASSFFDKSAIEIYPGSKLRHFKAIHQRTGVPYDEMVFFDDEKRNREVAQLGVTFVLVPNGVNKGVFQRGLEDWRKGKSVEVEQP